MTIANVAVAINTISALIIAGELFFQARFPNAIIYAIGDCLPFGAV